MSKTYEARVKVVSVGETEDLSRNKDGSFMKRDVIGMVEGEYPDYYKFEFIKNKTELADSLIPDTYATFYFNIRGKKVESKKSGEDPKYFTSLQAWKVDIG